MYTKTCTLEIFVASMAAPLATLLADARARGIEEEFLAPLEKTIGNVRAQLEAL